MSIEKQKPESNLSEKTAHGTKSCSLYSSATRQNVCSPTQTLQYRTHVLAHPSIHPSIISLFPNSSLLQINIAYMCPIKTSNCLSYPSIFFNIFDILDNNLFKIHVNIYYLFISRIQMDEILKNIYLYITI